MTRDTRLGILYILIAVTGYSFFAVFTKTLLGEGMKPVEIGVWRFIIASALMWMIRTGVRLRQRQSLALPRLSLRALLIMGAMMAAAALAGFYGLERLPSATYLVLFYTYPMMTALIEAVMGERLPRAAWVALVLTLIGVAFAAPDFSEGLRGENLSGVIIAFVNALVIAVYYIVSSRSLRHIDDTIGSTAMILSATLAAVLVVGLVMGIAAPPTPIAWLVVTLLAIIGTVIPVFMLTNGIPKLGAAQAGIVGSIEPMQASILAWIFLGEAMTLNQWIGGVVIVAAIIVLQAPTILARRRMNTLISVPPTPP
ncbi:MAG: DMT family transporter [Anaerolineae bacterium]|nr:DMT family transporter [Anaerolineae bacterium]NUQ03467.1 DMT family transporter [Anaerolineae bacterium]